MGRVTVEREKSSFSSVSTGVVLYSYSESSGMTVACRAVSVGCILYCHGCLLC